MGNVKKVLAVLSVAAVVIPAAFAAQPSSSQGVSNATAPMVGGPAYGGPAYAAPGYYAPPAYYGPYHGSNYRGRTWGRGSGSGHMRVSVDFDGFANGCMPWNGWW